MPILLHADPELLVVDKPAGLLTIATAKERERTAYYLLTDLVRRETGDRRARIYIVHRLDRETSGVLVFARTPEAKNTLQSRWDETEKRYLAVVHGRPEPAEGTITSLLAENRAYRVYSTQDAKRGKLSHTEYRVVKTRGVYACLEVQLVTGRKHQIRVHLADLGHPVVGDERYGRPEDRHALALHARSISFRHPASGELVTFMSPVPASITKLVGPIGGGRKGA